MFVWQQLLSSLSSVVVGGLLGIGGGYSLNRFQSRGLIKQARLERIRSCYSLLLSQMGLINRLYADQVKRKRPNQTEIDQAQAAHDEVDMVAGRMILEEMNPEHKHIMDSIVQYREIVATHDWQHATTQILSQLSALYEDVSNSMRDYIRKLESKIY